MKIPKGYKILVIDPKGLLLGQIELAGRLLGRREESDRLAGEILDTLLYGPSGEENKELAEPVATQLVEIPMTQADEDRLFAAIFGDEALAKLQQERSLNSLKARLGDGLLFAGTPDEFLDMIEGKEG